jgi:uncharacterized repeat protein (TIGR01451 family)
MKKLLFILLIFVSAKTSNAQCTAVFNSFGGGSAPALVSFTDSSFGFTLPVTYQWDFGDGSTSTIQNPQHTYTVDGTYLISLIVSDGTCSDTAYQSINIFTPTPSFNISYFDADSSSLYYCTAPQSAAFMLYGNVTGYAMTDSFLIEISYGDGVDTSFYLILNNLYFYSNTDHIYQNPGTYTASLIVTAPDLQTDTAYAQSISISSTCGPISGIVYEDINANCIYDSGDILLPNISLTLFNGTQYVAWTNTDSNGVYSFNVPSGSTYEIHVDANNGYSSHYTATCPISGIITVSSIPSSGNDFGLGCPPAFDLRGNVTGWGFRPGFTTSVCVSAFNQFCNTPNGQIELVLSSNLTPLPDTAGIGYTISGNTVTFPISGPEFYWSFCFPVAVSTSAQIGDSACITMNITPTAGDSFPSNNSDVFCFPIRNSWDPNDKNVVPAGVGPQGAIRPNTELTYTIRFQNTGNAEAINIYILDTLDSDLDPASIEVIGFSHDMQWALLTGNILRFNFNNILLPDSNANEPASHGFVTYRINQNNNVPHMSQINNSASIYFDFNPPIYTNVVVNTIDQFLALPKFVNPSSLLSVFPNPANDKCVLSFIDNTAKEITVIDVLGNEVYRKTIASNNFTLSTEKFAVGLYTIRITDENAARSAVKLMITH